ncbi:MAG TPA: hypothetical protein VG755_34770 [Nannocystaceae bacterium]|nr:hypothetical protein [Nannocystaceae bacterium]
MSGDIELCSGAFIIAIASLSSAAVSALEGFLIGPWRASSALGAAFHRVIVVGARPISRHAAVWRAPDATASASSSMIMSRSVRPCRRPRPPRSPPLFFEHEQRRCFGERLLLARELGLELAHLLARRQSLRFALQRLLGEPAPLLELGEVHSFATQELTEFFALEACGALHDRQLLRARSRVRTSCVASTFRSLFRSVRRWTLLARHRLDLRSSRQPTRQRRLGDPRLHRQLRR